MSNKPIYSNIALVPLPLAVWLATDEYKYGKYANEISTTTIMRSPRYIIGSRRIQCPQDFPEHLHIKPDSDTPLVMPDIQQFVKARIGTAIHNAAELAWTNRRFLDSSLQFLGYPEEVIKNVLINPEPEQINENSLPVYIETRAYKELDGFVISGQFDFIVNGNLHDIKTTSSYVYQTDCMAEKYILQGSIYRWLNPELITGDKITINYVFTDYKTPFKPTEGYPPFMVMGKQYPLMSLDETEAYLRNKIKLLKKHWEDPLHLIPCCTEKDLYNTPSKFKYYKKGYTEGARASKVFDSLSAASAYKNEQGNIGDIIEVKGKAFYCDFCDPNETSNISLVGQEPDIEFE